MSELCVKMLCANLNWKLKSWNRKRRTFDRIVSGGSHPINGIRLNRWRKNKNVTRWKIESINEFWPFGINVWFRVLFVASEQARACPSTTWKPIDAHCKKIKNKETDKPNYQSQYWTVFCFFLSMCLSCFERKTN